jgi:Lon protease-like protein
LKVLKRFLLSTFNFLLIIHHSLMDSNQRILPIFPLPIVQFPGTATPLHIFEERYQKMLRDILLTDKMFGITYRSDEPETILDAPPIGSVGCAVEVIKVESLPEGRADILCGGSKRYRTLSYVEGEPYLQANVEFFDDDPGNEDLTAEMAQAERLFRRMIAASDKIDEDAFAAPSNLPELPDDPQLVSLIIAAGLGLKPEERQAMLALTDTGERLRRVVALLEDWVPNYERRAQVHQISKHNGHGGPLSRTINEGNESD